jgi:RNA polymerase sigma factor (sigma-70 family)
VQGAVELVDGFFRHEAGRLLATLVRQFGPANLDLAEDVVQDVLCQALETWKFGRLPDNPAAWLVQAARHRVVDVLRHGAVRRRLAPAVADTDAPVVADTFFGGEITDDQLRMMFTCCAPGLAPETQVALVLKILCGFGVGEIAQALLLSDAAVEKQITRGKAFLRQQAGLFDIASPAVAERSTSVRDALYLLFNEGYHGSNPQDAVREDLCVEALRLGLLLASHPAGATPATYALVSLMCFHASRVGARLDDTGSLVLLGDQDRSRWNRALIAEGFRALGSAGQGDDISPYHLEAGIAAKHAAAPSLVETDWIGIVNLYDMLMRIRPSPIVALNRAIAIGQVDGPVAALNHLRPPADEPRLQRYPFFAAAQGQMYLRSGARKQAAIQFRRAVALARNPAEANLLRAQLRLCEDPADLQ